MLGSAPSQNPAILYTTPPTPAPLLSSPPRASLCSLSLFLTEVILDKCAWWRDHLEVEEGCSPPLVVLHPFLKRHWIFQRPRGHPWLAICRKAAITEHLGRTPFTFKNCRPGLVSRSAGTPGDTFTGSQSGIKELASQLGSAPSKAGKRTWLCKANDHFPVQGACH